MGEGPRVELPRASGTQSQQRVRRRPRPRRSSSSSAPCSSALLGALLDAGSAPAPLFLLVFGLFGVRRRRASPPTTSTRPRSRATRRGSRGHDASGSAADARRVREPDRRRPRAARAARRAGRASSSPGCSAASTAPSAPRSGSCSSALNFLVSARLITWAAQASPGARHGRRCSAASSCASALILGIVARARARSRGSTCPCSCSRSSVAHLALLVWETRYVSLTLAAPGLKPGVGDVSPDKEQQCRAARRLRLPADRRALPVEGHLRSTTRRSRSTRPSCSS